MIRRDFLKKGALTTLLPFHLGSKLPRLTANVVLERREQNIVEFLVDANDKLIPNRLNRQEKQIGHRWYGGIPNQFGIHNSIETAHFIKILTGAFVSPASFYYQSSELLEAMENAATYLLTAQHEDGTIDLLSTNFHSTPDTGFVVEPLATSLTVLNKRENPELIQLKSKIKEFLLKAGKALAVGGIHTPNHRWVVCRALARIFTWYPNNIYLNRIGEWLAEKVDIDPDGQYTEKSTSIYTPLTNNCLITLARLLQREDLFEAVRKNLEMTLYYVQPNGEVVTTASRRQDQYQRGSMTPYYYSYRYMAIKDQNKRFAGMTNWIYETASNDLVGDLIYFLEDDFLLKTLPEDTALPANYRKIFFHSDVARIRRNIASATILAKNSTFFSFFKQDAVLSSVRLAAAFFGKGQFEGNELLVTDNKLILKQKLFGPYYQPFPKDKLPEDGDWSKMPRIRRPQSEVQRYEAIVTVSESGGNFEINFQITGTEHVPLAIELAFRQNGKLYNVEPIADIPDAYLLKDGFGQFTYHNHTITFGPGCTGHSWTQLRGAEPKLDGQSVYITSFTPFDYTLILE